MTAGGLPVDLGGTAATVGLLAAVGWAALAGVEAVVAGRARRRLGARRGGRAGATADRWRAAMAGVGGTGGRLARAARRRPVAVVVVAVGGIAVGPVPALGAAALGAVVVVVRRRRAARAAAEAVVHHLPDTVDLVRLAAAAGFTPHLVARAVGRHGAGPVAAALGEASLATARGVRLADALEDLRRLGPAVGPLVDALVATERYGAPLVPAAEQLAADARHDRRRRAEEAARTVPVRLLFPLVACVLPSVGLLTVVPVAVAALDDLAP